MEMVRRLVVLIGYRRTGKDTIADTLINGGDVRELYPKYLTTLPKLNRPIKIALADKLKEDVRDMLGYPITEENKDKKLEVFPSGFNLTDDSTNRDVLIQHGMNMRKIDENYWINIVLDKINKYDGDVIVTDCRFKNEVDIFKALKDMDVVTVRLFRNSVTIPPYNLPSEHELDKYHADHLLCDTIESYIEALKLFY